MLNLSSNSGESVYGPAAVSRLVEQRGWDYPVSVARIEQACALENVAVDEDGHMMMVAELLAEVDVGRFESRDHLVSTLEPVCEDIRAERRRGLVQRLRETFLGS